MGSRLVPTLTNEIGTEFVTHFHEKNQFYKETVLTNGYVPG